MVGNLEIYECIHMYLPFDIVFLPLQLYTKDTFARTKNDQEIVYSLCIILIVKNSNSLNLHSLTFVNHNGLTQDYHVHFS